MFFRPVFLRFSVVETSFPKHIYYLLILFSTIIKMSYWKIKDVDNARPLFFVISFNRRKITVDIVLKLSKAYSKLSVLLEDHNLSSTALDGSSIPPPPPICSCIITSELGRTWLVWFHPRPTESSPAGLTVTCFEMRLIVKHIQVWEPLPWALPKMRIIWAF